jgi:mRNA-degrading endonuclease toxin of MazEF toxin-antitoxin module
MGMCQVLVTPDRQQRKAMADQIATVSKLRLRGHISRLDVVDTAAVDRAIRIQLAL